MKLKINTYQDLFKLEPLDSFTVLADSTGVTGLLTARQVLSLALLADLVTLSACQTGLGIISGEGMIGLSRAFLVCDSWSRSINLLD